MLLKLKVKEKEATKNIPRGRQAPWMQGGGGKGEGVGRGDGEEGTPEAPEGGVGGDGGSISLLSPRTAPLSRRFGAARSPILQNPGWGRERNRSARPPGCQADVVGHLKFTEGGGRVKVMVSRARVVCECVRFRCRQAARSISPSRNIRGGAGPGDARGAGGSGRVPSRLRVTRAAAKVASKGTCRLPSPQTFLFLSLSRYAGVDAQGLGCAFFPLP